MSSPFSASGEGEPEGDEGLGAQRIIIQNKEETKIKALKFILWISISVGVYLIVNKKKD